jgi:lysozyme
MMKLSGAGLDFIAAREEFSPTPYRDVAGLWTTGFGHLIRNPETDPLMHKTLTRELARELLADDVGFFEKCINEVLDVDVLQCEFDALVSLAFNIGCAACTMSTLLKKLNAGDKEGAAEQFRVWVYAGGKRVQGLANRRAMEEAMFRGERWQT